MSSHSLPLSRPPFPLLHPGRHQQARESRHRKSPPVRGTVSTAIIHAAAGAAGATDNGSFLRTGRRGDGRLCDALTATIGSSAGEGELGAS